MDRGEGRIGRAEAESTLAWWAEAGVDTLVADMPRDWLKPDALERTHRRLRPALSLARP
jgi:uracil-DNA glycosylase